MAPWWFTFSLLVVTAAIGTLVIGFARAGARTSSAGGRSPVVRMTLWVAVVWAAASIIGALVAVLSTLMQDDVRITVPVEEYWPRLPEGTEFDGPTASIDGGGFTSASLIARGLGAGTRVMWALSQGIAWLLPGIIAAVLAVACWQLLTGRAFRPVIVGMALFTAAALAVGGIAVQVLGDVAGYQAGVELLQLTSAQYPDVPQLPDSDMSTWLPRPRFEVTIPFWPVAAGLAFAALAAILRHGSRLQRDTEGLV